MKNIKTELTNFYWTTKYVDLWEENKENFRVLSCIYAGKMKI